MDKQQKAAPKSRAAKGGAAKKPAKRTALKRKDLHKAILQAAEAAGEEFGEGGLVAYLRAQALATPSPFLTLLGKALADDEQQSEQPLVRVIELVAAPAPVCPEDEENKE